jgi:nucleotide-binding universal stress UspA family protein
MFKTILVPTDGSPLSRAAEDAAIAFARMNGATVVGVAVAQPAGTVPAKASAQGRPENGPPDTLTRAQDRVEDLARRAQQADIPSQCSVAFSAYAYQEILKAAADFQCDAIFMSSHGEHGARQELLGSETQQVLVHARLPVLVFR